MLHDPEILVDLTVRVPGHACWIYTGIYQGVSRHQRRQAVRDSRAYWNAGVRSWRKHMQAEKLVDNIESVQYTMDQMKEWYGQRLLVNPIGYICVALRTENLEFLRSRGYLPVLFLEEFDPTYGRCRALPWPPKSQRKLCRWQLPPKGKKFRQPGGLAVDSIPAISLFPEEWRPKDAYDVEDEDDEA